MTKSANDLLVLPSAAPSDYERSLLNVSPITEYEPANEVQ